MAKNSARFAFCKISRFALTVALLLIGGAMQTAAQTNQPGGSGGGARPGGGQAGSSSTQQGIGGQPGGLQQEQEQEQRRRQQQQQQQQQQQTSPNTASQTASQPANQQQQQQQQQNSQPGGAANSNGTIGEPAGATSPRANIGGDAVLLPNANQPSTGAARTLQTAPATLSLPDAIAIAIENNLSTLLAAERINEARGFLEQSRSFLLPNVNGTAFQQNRTLNLAAQGISGGSMMTGGMMMGGIPTFVGPFNTFDARLNFSQSVLNISAFRDFKSGKAAVKLAEFNVELQREAVAAFAALSYLNVQRSDQERSAASVDLQLAQSLLTLAQDQRSAGVASGVDVVRAESRVARERLRVLQAEASREQARLDFERVVGLPSGSQTLLTDVMMIRDEAAPEIVESVRIALDARFEIRIADQTLRQREQDRRARVAELYPTLDAFGDYGDSANTPFENNRTTRAFGVRLNVPIYDGGFTRGRIAVAASQKRQAELQLGSTRGQVEEDVRVALVSLRLTVEQTKASEEQFRLAERELNLAAERFRAGVADNTEIISAQAGLANARTLRIQAIAQYNSARLNFAAATGRAQTFRL